MLLKLYQHDNSQRTVNMLCDVLRDDARGVVAYPSDSGYAIACNALHPRAVERICEIKGILPAKSHFSIVCYDMSEISKYARVDNKTFKLMKHNLPGPFTFILEGLNLLPKVFRSRRTLGIRMPSSPLVMEMLRIAGCPLMTASLPLMDGDAPEYSSDPELVDERWGERVDYVIDGGENAPWSPTTIVDCTGREPEIVRQGAGELLQ